MFLSLIRYGAATMAWFGGGEVPDLTDGDLLCIIPGMANLLQREEEFLSTLERSKDTVATYRYALQRFNDVVGSGAQLTIETYVKFLKSLHDLSPSTQRVYRTAVRRFYDHCDAGDERQLKRADEHYTKKRGKRFPNPNMDNIDKLVAYMEEINGDLQTLRDRAFVLLLVDTGFRISEAVALKRGNVDWKRSQAVIVGKGDKQAVVRFSERSIRALKDYLSARAKLDGASGKALESLPLFSRHDRGAGNKIKPIGVGGMWFSIKGQMNNGEIVVPGRMREAGIDPKSVRIHDLRHYFVTRIVQATGNLKLAQELARHESVSVTQDYAHLSNAELDKGYDDIFNG